MVLANITVFIFIYANGVAGCKAYQYAKRSVRRYVKNKFSYQRIVVPMLVKNKDRPYGNIRDIGLVQSRGKKQGMSRSSAWHSL